MNGYDNTGYSHDYQPWLKLNKQQMADPFGWLQSQNVNVRALLKQMKLDDRWIDNILRGNPPREDMKQHYDKDRLSVGQKAIQFFQKQQLLHGLNEGRKVKLNEQQLRQVIKEAISEIGNTPAGQWMLGRLAGRQQNRAQGKEPGWNTRYGKIKNTTTDAAQYAKSQRQTPYDDYPFYQGRDLENNDWAKDEDNANNYDQQWKQIQGYGDAMSNMIQYHAKQNGNRISESKLKSVISNAIKESLHGGDEYLPQADEYYVCSETDYNSGSVDAWIGDKEDAEYCEQSSEGSAIGPFKTYGEAVHYANTNGIEIRDPYERSHNPEDDSDYYHHKLSKSEMQGDEISRLYNNYSLTGQLPSDEDIKRVTRISESKIRKAISESIKKVLREGEFDTMDWDYAANPSNELEDTPTTQFNREGFQKQVYDNDDRQEILWAIKHFLTNDISADAVHMFERNEQLWQAAWDNVDTYLGGDKEEFIREAEQMKYSLPNGWALDDVFNIVKTVKTGLQGSDTLAESKRTIRLNESQLRKIISKSVKKVLKEYELSDREKDIMRGYWGDVESRRMPKEKYEPYKPQSQKTNSSNIKKPKRWKYDNKQNK